MSDDFKRKAYAGDTDDSDLDLPPRVRRRIQRARMTAADREQRLIGLGYEPASDEQKADNRAVNLFYLGL